MTVELVLLGVVEFLCGCIVGGLVMRLAVLRSTRDTSSSGSRIDALEAASADVATRLCSLELSRKFEGKRILRVIREIETRG